MKKEKGVVLGVIFLTMFLLVVGLVSVVNGQDGELDDSAPADATITLTNDPPQIVRVDIATGNLDLFEDVFQHTSFTGRSGTFFAYEGLGSVYWHMNSKLLLAVQEVMENALKENKNINALENHYKEIKEGLGVHKNPSVYGAFPIDPYSHTPAGKGAQQPGMTGQVKEDIISRYGEMGVRIEEGKLSFCQRMININELLSKPAVYEYFQIGGDKDLIELEEGSLAFTFCQTPIIYVNGFENKIAIHYKTKDISEIQGHNLSEDISNSVFKRIGEIAYIQVYFRIS